MKLGFQTFIVVAALGGLVAASYFLFFTKANQHRLELAQDTASMERALADLQKTTEGVGDLNHKITELQQAVTFFESKLPQAKEVDKILKEVWQLAETNSLQTKTIRTPKSQRGANFSQQDMEMSLSGDFNGFYTFLLQLEKLPRLTRVQKMGLNKINDRDGDMQAEMTLTIFFEPDADASVATAR